MTNQAQKEMLEKEYEKMIHARDFHYDNFNKWSAYFCVFIGALFVAYYNVARDDVYLKLSIAILGYIVSYLSYLSCRGYYFWWQHWNLLVDNFEKTHQGNIPRVYSVFADKDGLQESSRLLRGLNISTSKVTILLFLLVLIAWCAVLIYECIIRWGCSYWILIPIVAFLGLYRFTAHTKWLQSDITKKRDLKLLKESDMIKLPTYTSFNEKSFYFSGNEVVENCQQLGALFSELQKNENNFIYRGISNATYKMYTSSQRTWLTYDRNFQKYFAKSKTYLMFLQTLMKDVKDVPEVKEYQGSENVHYNEMWLLGLMQHYSVPSVMLDFSTSFYKGLFFATDGGEFKDEGGLNDYVSLYVMPKNLDWVQASIQHVMQDAADRMNDIIKMNNLSQNQYKAVLQELEELPLEKVMDIPFICVSGNTWGKVKIDIHNANFHTEYTMINPRLEEQSGMFFANLNDKPFEQNLLNAEAPSSSPGASKDYTFAKRRIRCININKKLVPYIVERYLKPNGINRENVYCNNDTTSNKLQKSIKKAIE